MPTAPISTVELVIIDLDGVIYRGDAPVPGAAGLVVALRDAGRVVRFATNNSQATRKAYVERLASHGVTAAPGEIVTSVSATIDFLHAHRPDVRRVLAVGADGMLAELRAAGFDAVYAADASPPQWAGSAVTGFDAVVAGLDPQIDYRRLGTAAAALRAGATFIATNTDHAYPMPDGFVPGAGSIVAALRVASGVEPLVIGKPEPAMFQAILEATGVPADQALVIGDNPDSDVLAARRAGIRSLLVLTGVADRALAEGLEGDRRPDWIAEGPAEAGRLLGVAIG